MSPKIMPPATLRYHFPRSGCIRTGTRGHAFVFDAMSGESYIHIREMDAGAQSSVNLVANLFTGELVVQKVSKDKLRLGPANNLTNVPEDHEIHMHAALDVLIHNPLHAMPPQLTPRWTTCISHENVSLTTGFDYEAPKPACTRVSYWKLCNGGILGDWLCTWRLDHIADRSPFPVSLIARCISQISETLHIMYHAGREPIYHCDLHMSNIFVHIDPDDSNSLPDFYIGDFGWARSASESQRDTKFLCDVTASIKIRAEWERAHPGFPPPNPHPEAPPLGQRRRWDVARFQVSLKHYIDDAITTGWELGADLDKLMTMMKFMDNQDKELAASDQNSRPPSLLELAREAKKLERKALAVEQGSALFRGILAMRRAQAKMLMEDTEPFVFTNGSEGLARLSSEDAKSRAEQYGRLNIEGPWSLLESV
jgi:hypothetical protein